MRVFIAGGTGFVGQELIGQLLAAQHQVVALVRPGSEAKLSRAERVTIHPGDATRPGSLHKGLLGCDAAINLIGIIREFPRQGITFEQLHHQATSNLVEAAKAQGVNQFLQMSANGTRPDAVTPYHQTKWAGEETVRSSGLDWTIFRPSLIFGRHDHFFNLLADLIKKLPLVPVLGDGRYQMTPVAVENVANGFVRALGKPAHAGQVYHCGGPQDLSYDEILDLIGRALGKKHVAKLHHPLLLMKPAIALLESIPQFPITRDQLTMLLEGNSCDPTPWAEAFDIDLIPFYAGICSYLQNPSTA
jgi:NADH dehydrogenase